MRFEIISLGDYLFGEKVKVRSWFCTVSNYRDIHKIQNYRKIGENIGKYFQYLPLRKPMKEKTRRFEYMTF